MHISDGPFTIFAPTDSAFEKIPEDTLKSILADKDLLSSILLRHVVPAAKFAKGVGKVQLFNDVLQLSNIIFLS